MNPVVISVCVMLVLALMRVNVVVALTFSAIVGGLVAGMSLNDTVAAFESGLGGGATIALSYAMLGTLPWPSRNRVSPICWLKASLSAFMADIAWQHRLA